MMAERGALAHARNLQVNDDLGSGTLLDTTAYGLAAEPRVQESVAAGADLVTFSGDKLLGGPQAGLIVGRARWIQALRQHPLARALRVDKITLAGLQATLLHYLRGEAATAVPVWRMISRPLAEIAEQAQAWVASLTDVGIMASVAPAQSTIGGGSLPGETLPTTAVTLAPPSAERLAQTLRRGEPPVVARVDEGRVWLDPRTVLPEEEAALLAAVRVAWESSQ